MPIKDPDICCPARIRWQSLRNPECIAVRPHDVLNDAMGIEARMFPSDSPYRYVLQQVNATALGVATGDRKIAWIPQIRGEEAGLIQRIPADQIADAETLVWPGYGDDRIHRRSAHLQYQRPTPPESGKKPVHR